MKHIVVDGNYLEGGGQILRTALAVSSILKVNITVECIRNNRKVPGLQHQHLTGVKLLKDICSADCDGDELKSVTLKFEPKSIKSGTYIADTRTAGSIFLIIQATVPTLLFGNEISCLYLKGGTDADFAPPIDYKEIVKHYLSKMGVKIEIEKIRRGFYPKGGGEAKVTIYPLTECIKPLTLTERGDIVNMCATCFVAGQLPLKMAEEMSSAILTGISIHSKYRKHQVNVQTYKETFNSAFGNGSGCMLSVSTSNGCLFGFNIVGKRDYSAHCMGQDVVRQFIDLFDNSKSCFDNQMQDQILLFMALARGKSTIRTNELTQHSRTCIYTLEQLMNVKFGITQIAGSKDVIVTCDGIGISPKDLE